MIYYCIMGIYTIATSLVLLLMTCQGYEHMTSHLETHLDLEPGYCDTNGYRCSDSCGTVQLCSNGQLFNITECGDSTYCDAGRHTCTSDRSNCSAPVPFSCCGPGLFPDLNDCSHYYSCEWFSTGHSPFGHSCPAGAVFDIATLNCSESASCSGSRAPDCSANPTGALEDNPSIYYICSNEGATVYLCRCNDSVWDQSTYSCGNSSTTTTSSPSSFTCSSQGIFGDPTSCTSFYVCSGDLVAHLNTCPGGSFFDQLTKSCERGSC